MLYNLININVLNSYILLDIVGILCIISSLLIILVINPMYSILYLIFLFINIAIYLYLIGISIMSLLYLLVYVGAIAILFLFILSLLDINNNNNNTSILYNNNIPFILILSYFLYKNIINYYNNIFIINNNNNSINNYNDIYNIFKYNWNIIFDSNHLNQIGFLLYTEYSILFVLLSLLLLFSIVSAIILINNK